MRAGQIRPGEFPTHRFIAFIDILGFRDLIDRMFADEPGLFGTLLEVLETSKEMAGETDPENVRSITAFSDSVVISEAGPLGMSGLLAYVRALTGQLLEKGVLCRGGIAQGRTYHAEGIIFGEGLVRAYDLERHVAKNPRIVIADDVAPAILFLIEDPIPRLKRDKKDGRLFFNVFNYFWKIESRPSHLRPDGCWPGSLDEGGLMRARNGLVHALSRARSKSVNDPSILEKVIWMIDQFNETLQEAGDSQIPPIVLD